MAMSSLKTSDTYCLGPEFFKRYQKILLWLLNAPLIKIWFRWVMRIRTYDCSLKEKIVEIAPHYYTVDAGLVPFHSSDLLKTIINNPENNHTDRRRAKELLKKILLGKKPDKEILLPALKTDFRTHNKFTKRLYYAFYPLWFLLHLWDVGFANQFQPAWNLGFDTLTVYPDADPETYTVDGSASATYDDTWSNLRNQTGNDYASQGTNTYAMGFTSTGTSNIWDQINRGIFLFKTDSLGSNAVISGATLSLYGSSKAETASPSWGADVNIYSSNPASNTALTGSDYSTLGSTAFSTAITYANWSVDAYNAFTLNSDGKNNINKTGISKFGSRNANYDVANKAPTWQQSKYVEMRYTTAEGGGTTTGPKLVVTYTRPNTAFLFTLIT